MRIVLDTNAYASMKRESPAVADLVRRAERIYLSAVVAGELFHGFRRGSRFERNVAELRMFLGRANVEWVGVTLETADRYGRIAAALQRKGRPIPSNDMWIAAHAMETGAQLVSADGHFEHIDGLAWIRPADPPSPSAPSS